MTPASAASPSPLPDAAAAPPELPPPSVFRRLATFTYEGVLLFGVVMLAGWLYSTLTQMRDARIGVTGLQLFLLVVLAIYFVWFWSHGGQTVAMRAWHVRLVDTAGRPVSQTRALARFALAWLWFAPALATAHFAGLHGPAIFGVLLAGVLGYAALARLHPQRQFWHDAACGTQLITWRPQPPSAKARARASSTA